MPNTYPIVGGVTVQVLPNVNPSPLHTGKTMDPHTVVNPLVNQAFLGRGTVQKHDLTRPSRFPRGPVLSGIRGSVEVCLRTGATGSQRTVFYLTDSTGTLDLVLFLDSNNRPFFSIDDIEGTVVSTQTRTGAAPAADVRHFIRMTWDSTAEVPNNGTTGRFATLTVNGIAIADSDWSLSTAAWAHFTPTDLVVGAPRGAGSEFNGSIDFVQFTNTVIENAVLP